MPSNRKWFRDFVIGEIMTETLEALAIPEPEPPKDMENLRQRYRQEERSTKTAAANGSKPARDGKTK